ncbi:MAG: 23S rRNA (adenine(1618)-N(6))-methyltransferase RlmF, partial [Bacteroidota bacterium]
NFAQLIKTCPDLKPFVAINKYGNESINFFDPAAVKMLNKALLQHHYGIGYWDIPDNYLCPPIPGRADYIHYLADLLASDNNGTIPTGSTIRGLDIGVGANCIYPIIGNHEYGWSFLGTDIDQMAIQNANQIIVKNKYLEKHIQLKRQLNPADVFYNVVNKKDKFDLVICNPPFHESAEATQAATRRKLQNLTGKKVEQPISTFGGQPKELWCEGGEEQFIRGMIRESKRFAPNILWFSTLVAKETTLKKVYRALKRSAAVEVKAIEMGQGNKKSRIVAWTFLGQKRRAQWVEKRWN